MKNIAAVIQKPAVSDTKLFVQQPSVQTKTPGKNIPAEPVNDIAATIQTTAAVQSKPRIITGNKKNLLQNLRDKLGNEYNVEEIKEAEALSAECLSEVWNEYIAVLENQPNKHSTIQTFKFAKLNVETDNFFTITVNSIVNQKFVEQEKTMMCDFVQQAFNNRSINFKILIEAGENEEIPIHLTLNSRQKFERIAEKYPLIKELKNKLNLDIDY